MKIFNDVPFYWLYYIYLWIWPRFKIYCWNEKFIFYHLLLHEVGLIEVALSKSMVVIIINILTTACFHIPWNRFSVAFSHILSPGQTRQVLGIRSFEASQVLANLYFLSSKKPLFYTIKAQEMEVLPIKNEVNSIWKQQKRHLLKVFLCLAYHYMYIKTRAVITCQHYYY